MDKARLTAYKALLKFYKNNGYSNLVLNSALENSNLDSRDRAFVSALFYGVIEKDLTLDYNISIYLRRTGRKPKTEIMLLLKLGAYQILYMDKIPNSAAVNETVTLAKGTAMSSCSGLINAVLRRISEFGLVLPRNTKEIKYLSVKYSCGEYIINKWLSEIGKENTIGILEAISSNTGIYIRINDKKINKDTLMRIFDNENIAFAEVPELPNALKINLAGRDIESLRSFKDGLFFVQDKACQISLEALSVKEDDVVYDLCASPGGKSFLAALKAENGKVLSFDLYPQRVGLIEKGAERLGLSNIETKVQDATQFDDTLPLADKIICDVPCSGFGVMGKKPEIKYKDENDIEGLSDIQFKILNNGSKYLKKNGRLLYSTCTINNDENVKVCNRFLDNNKNFKIIRPFDDFSYGDLITLMPHKNDCDGFFIAVFERIE